MELISVVVPVYNVRQYLEQCVNSLVNQTYKNIEIILVDDGSTDNSGEICDKLAEFDDRIYVIHKKNEGLGFARNSGLEVAKGTYVTFIDSDDFADANLVERLVNGLKINKADTCIGGFKRINNDGVILLKEIYQEEFYQDKEVYNKLFARMLGSAPEKRDAVRMSVWNSMYSMEIIKKHNIKFPSERQFISEDIVWDSDYYRFSKAVQIIDSAEYNYRVTPGSLTQKYNPAKLKMICDLYLEIERRLAGDKEKIQRLQRQFFVNLRSCIRQENKKISGKKYSEIKQKLKVIVNDGLVSRIVCDYPIKKIQLKPKIFLICIKYKFIILLHFLLNLGLV